MKLTHTRVIGMWPTLLKIIFISCHYALNKNIHDYAKSANRVYDVIFPACSGFQVTFPILMEAKIWIPEDC